VARNEIITGLDIGTTRICALVAETSSDAEIRIIGVGVCPSLGMRKGVVVDIEATTRAIEDAVSKATQQIDREIHSVYVGVTGEHIASLNSSARIAVTRPDREITQADVDRVVEASRVIVLPPDRQILHAIPRSYTIDGQNGIRQPVGMSGARLEVQTHIVHGASTFLQNVEKCVAQAGLDVADEVLEPLAAAEAVLLPAEKELGVCLVDIGGGTTDLAVFMNGEIHYSAVIPVAGDHVTNDIAFGLSVSRDEAESIKIEHGSAAFDLVDDSEVISVRQIGREDARRMRRRALAQIIEPRVQEIFQLVRDELMKADCAHLIPAGMVICGGGSQLQGCLETAHRATGLSVRVGTPQGISGPAGALDQPMYATAVGLVLYGAQMQRAGEEISTQRAAAGPRSVMDRMMHFIRGLLDF
jgi:cell division protein FtsA